MMKTKLVFGAMLSLGIIGLLVGTPGCLTSRQTTGTGTNAVTVTVVNTNNLILDASLLRGAVASTWSLVLPHNPSMVQPLKDAEAALNGALTGINTNQINQVIGALKAQNNQVVQNEVGNLLQTLSALEQRYVVDGVSQNAAAYVAYVLAKAVDDGLQLALQGR